MVMVQDKRKSMRKVAGVFVIAYGKFQVSGISGKVTGEGHRKF